jgi:methylated-DNA-[protein]-cysteine S-methyltransferase
MAKAETAVFRYCEVDSPIGKLVLVGKGNGLCHIEFGSYADRSAALQAWAGKHGAGEAEWRLAEDDALLVRAAGQLEEYFRGTREAFDVPLDLLGTSFQRSVWEELLRIPHGEVRSYKQVAVGIGKPQAMRAVGGANNRNPVPIIVPCHRVIGADGSMVGYGGGMGIKTYLLEHERKRLPIAASAADVL